MEKRDNIYIYLWKEFNTIYVGRTINPKSRHYQHRHIPTERTYQFSSNHGVEHPKMIIIENDLTIEEGVEREKYWIEYYRGSTGYNVLNKSCGGQTGQQKTSLTEEEKKKRQKEYYKKNKDKILEYTKNYSRTHKRKYSEKRKEYMKEYHKEYDKKYREEHRKEILAKKKKYREENRERILEQKRRYRETHKEELRLKAREYQKMIRESKKIS